MRNRAATSGGRYVLLVVAVVVAAVAGYVGYLLYPRFDLPSVAGAGLLALAAAAGFAAFFSPCSFPLLATLLARQAGAGQPSRVRLRRAVLFAASPSGLIPLTCNEVQHLFAALVAQPAGDLGHRLRWSAWRRRHQARARTCHYRRQANRP